MLASVFDSDDDSDDFRHLDSESKEEEDEGSVCLYLPAEIRPAEAGSA